MSTDNPQDSQHNTVDLSKLSSGYNVAVKTAETQAEVATRLKIQEADESHRRRKDLVTHLFGIALIATVLVVSIVLVFSSDKDIRQVGASTLPLIVGGFIGYVTGSATSKSSKN